MSEELSSKMVCSWIPSGSLHLEGVMTLHEMEFEMDYVMESLMLMKVQVLVNGSMMTWNSKIDSQEEDLQRPKRRRTVVR